MNGTPAADLQIHVLLLDDDESFWETVRSHMEWVTSYRWSLDCVSGYEESVRLLRERSHDIYLLGVVAGGAHRLSLLDAARRLNVDRPFIVLHERRDRILDAEAMEAGATDSLARNDMSYGVLQRAIRYGLDRHAATTALQQREARFRALVENSTDAIVLMDRDAMILFASESIRHVSGYEPAELVGRPAMQHVHPDDLAGVRASFERCLLEPGVPIRAEYRAFRKDGLVRHRESVGVNRLDDPAVGAIVLNHRDISDRKQAEEMQMRLVSIVEHSDDAITSIALDGTVTSWNAAAERIYGVTAAEMIGRSIERIVPPDRRDEIQEIIHEIGVGAAVRRMETVRLHRDGRRIPIWLTLSPIKDAQGRVIGRSALVRDLTEQKKLEEHVRQSQRIETVGRLAGGIAHDFNNLLTAILGYTELLLEGLESDDPKRADVDEIRRASESAASLTRQLLAFSRKQVLQPELLDVNAIVSRLSGIMRRLVGEPISVITRLAPDLWATVADPSQLEQVIVNLTVNARDAMPQGGTLELRTQNQAVGATQAEALGVVAGDYVRLTVSDTGEGMDATVMARIFEPFFTTKAQGKGTGLGLATVHGIVQQSHGAITVESEPGRGSAFHVYLPRGFRAEPEPHATPRHMAQAQGRELVLLVEDETAVRRLARRILTSRGYRVLDAAGGAEALDLVARQHDSIDLLLTDVVMGGMNGKQLAEQVVRQYPETRVLFMSGYADEALAVQGVLDAGTHFLQKPFTADALLRKIRDVLDRD